MLPYDINLPIVEQSCTVCHSERLIMAQNLDRKKWDNLIAWMVEKQQMPELDNEEKIKILDYLEKYFGKKNISDDFFLAPINDLPI